MRHFYLFTDFGYRGPYVGQMHARLADLAAAGVTVIDLMHDAPCQDPKSSAYLLAALVSEMPAAALCVAVVDPGVGTSRAPVVLEAGGRTFVGPDNGLLSIVAKRSPTPVWRRIGWRPETLSSSFHGRDLFAPAARKIAVEAEAWLHRWTTPFEPSAPPIGVTWPEDQPAVVYIDAFGNAMTGLRAGSLGANAALRVGDRRLAQAETFGAVPEGRAFWYENSIGLAEIAVNRGRAADQLQLSVGSPITSE